MGLAGTSPSYSLSPSSGSSKPVKVQIYDSGAYITKPLTSKTISLPYTTDTKDIVVEGGGHLLKYYLTPGYMPGATSNYGQGVNVSLEDGSISGTIISDVDELVILSDDGKVYNIRKWISVQGKGDTSVTLDGEYPPGTTIKYKVRGIKWSASTLVTAIRSGAASPPSPGGSFSKSSSTSGGFSIDSKGSFSKSSDTDFKGSPYSLTVKLSAQVSNNSSPISGIVTLISSGSEYESPPSYRQRSYYKTTTSYLASASPSPSGDYDSSSSSKSDYTIFYEGSTSLPLSTTFIPLGDFKVEATKYYTVDVNRYSSSDDPITPGTIVLRFITPKRLPPSTIVVTDGEDGKDINMERIGGSMKAEGDEVELTLSSSFNISAKVASTNETKVDTDKSDVHSTTKYTSTVTISSSITNSSDDRALVYLVYPIYRASVDVDSDMKSRFTMKGSSLRISVVVDAGKTVNEVFSFDLRS